MTFGGLRGAVSIALALAVKNNADIDLVSRTMIMLQTSGIVLGTLFLNGTGMGFLYKVGRDEK
jgi:CPA1 family monovalent cation:H+ antiporter